MLTQSTQGMALLMTVLALGFATSCGAEDRAATRPGVGDAAQDFELQAVAGSRQGKVKLSEVLKEGPVVLAVLRGYPGYQCPACSKKVGSLIGKARELKSANVLLIYPGPALELNLRAGEFLQGTELPAGFTMLLDPDYSFTNAYGLRWDAPRETAYPSTFVIDSNGKVRYRKVSMTHGDRANATEVAQAVANLEN